MAMQLHATDGPQFGIQEYLPEDTSPDRGNAMPAASLTGDVVERGRKRPALQSKPSPAEKPARVEPQFPQIEVVKEVSSPVETLFESTVPMIGEKSVGEKSVSEISGDEISGDENFPAVADEETSDVEIAAMARSYRWFNLFRNAVFFIFVFWVGAIIAAMVVSKFS